jgi:probable HAF family extracellular repeat protein
MLRNKRWAFPVIPALAVTLTGLLALPGQVLRAQVRRDFSASLANARQSASKSDSEFHFATLDVPGAQASRAMGINAQGTIVGSFDDDNGTHAFVFDGRTFTTIDVPGSPFTQAKCINSRGEIVGYYSDSDGNLHGFGWFRGKFRFIDVSNSIETRSEGITDAGLISGEYVDQDGNEHGYLLRGEIFQTIDVPNTFSTDVWMVSNDGWLTGDYSSATTVLAYVRTDQGVYLTLDYPGAVADSARAINDRHEVVGRWDDDSLVPDQIPCITQCHGFWWSKGEFRDIDFPGAIYTVALGINDQGVIVGRYVDASGNEHGFIAEPHHPGEAGSNEVLGRTASDGQQE